MTGLFPAVLIVLFFPVVRAVELTAEGRNRVESQLDPQSNDTVYS